MIRVPLVASNAFRRAFGTKTPVLISVADAAASKDQFVFVDGSFHVGGTRNSQTEYLNEHIPNARYFDINSVCDKTNSLPHMVPSTDTWIESMNKFIALVLMSLMSFNVMAGDWKNSASVVYLSAVTGM